MITNFDPLDIPNSGFTIPAGTGREDQVRLIADGLLALAPTVLGEVTGGGPAGLTAHASTITAVDGGNAEPEHVTLYFKSDPLLPNDACMIRLLTGEYGCWSAWADSANMRTNTDESWVMYARPEYLEDYDTYLDIYNNRLLGTFNYDEYPEFALLAPVDSAGNWKTDSTDATLDDDVKVWAFVTDNFLHVQCRSATNQTYLGGFTVWRHDVPGDSRFVRSPAADAMPSILGLSLHDGETYNSHLRWNVLRPRVQADWRNAWHDGVLRSEFGDRTIGPDANGESIVQRMFAVCQDSDRNYGVAYPFIPNLRIAYDQGSAQLHGTVTINARDYVVMQKRDSLVWLLPTDNASSTDE